MNGRHRLIALAVNVLLAACVGPVATPRASSTPTSAVTRLPSEQPSRQCEVAPPALVTAISAGLVKGTRLIGARIVRDPERDGVWLVAAELDGPGITGPGEVAVWATDRLDDPVSIYAVDAFALEFSSWPRVSEPRLAEWEFARACL